MDMLWSGRDEDLVQVLDDVEGVRVMPIDASIAADPRPHRPGRAGPRAPLSATSTSRRTGGSRRWCMSMAAEAALYAGLPDLAATAYDRLLPFAGMPSASGSGTVIGPVDTFLAMAALATGERDLATRHADDAARLCAEWEIPLAASWLASVPERAGSLSGGLEAARQAHVAGRRGACAGGEPARVSQPDDLEAEPGLREDVVEHLARHAVRRPRHDPHDLGRGQVLLEVLLVEALPVLLGEQRAG